MREPPIFSPVWRLERDPLALSLYTDQIGFGAEVMVFRVWHILHSPWPFWDYFLHWKEGWDQEALGGAVMLRSLRGACVHLWPQSTALVRETTYIFPAMPQSSSTFLWSLKCTLCVHTLPWTQPCLKVFGNAQVTWLRVSCRQGCLVIILAPPGHWLAKCEHSFLSNLPGILAPILFLEKLPFT